MLFQSSTLWKPQFARRYDQANSPLHLWTEGTAELRSQLFPERQRIPSRKGKYLITLGLMLQMWGVYHMSKVRQQYQHKKLENNKLERKAAPFLQAIADIRYCAITEKKDIIMKEVFDKEHYEKIKDRFFQKDIWVPFRTRYPHMYNRTTKNPIPFRETHLYRYQQGLDVYNI